MIHGLVIHVALVLGFLLAAVVISSMLRRHRSPSSTLAGLLVGCVGMALVVGVLASLPPARRAGRLRIIRALQYE